MAKLIAKQARFVEEYLIDLNAKQAAIRAGYSPDTAEQIGYQLLQKTSVRNAIDKAKAERSRRTGINQDRVIQEIAKLGLANMRNFVDIDEDGEVRIKSMDEIAPEDSACIKKIETRKVTRTTDDGEIVDVTTKIELHDKKGSLELLGNHLGIFGKDDNDGDNEITINVVYGAPPPPEDKPDG